MASLALVRALSVSNPPAQPRPHRVPSSAVIERMKTIHEDAPLTPCPIRKPRGKTFTYGATNEVVHFTKSPSYQNFHSQSERVRLLSHKELEDKKYECCDEKTCHNVMVGFLGIMTVISMVTQIVSLPLFMDAMSDRGIGSDAFIASFIATIWQPVIFFAVIFFFIWIQDPKNVRVFVPTVAWSNVAVAGVLGGLSVILVALTSSPNRTAPGVQAILQQLSVPCTVFTRFVVLRKGINKTQAVCIFTLAIGIFITLEPTIFGITNVGPIAYREEANPHAWYYYFTYGLAQLPLAFSYALMEQGQKTTEVESMAYAAWYQFFLLLSYALFVWIDFIPGFGMAISGSISFFDKLRNGFLCFYAVDKSCKQVAPLAAIYTLSTAGTTLFSILLIRYAEGAVFTVIVMTFATPLTTLFWTLFSPEGTIHWAPKLDLTAAFLLVGVAIMTPSVAMYAYFGNDSANSEESEAALEKKKMEKMQQLEEQRRKAIQERAKRSRRNRRHNTVGAGAYRGRRMSQSEALLGSPQQQRPIHRVKSAPVMFGGF